MKKLAFLLTLALAASARAQATPGSISFVARLADNGTPITGSHDLVLSLFDASTAGNSVWTETRTGVTIPSDGLLYLDLGSVTPLDATVFSGSKRYLEVTIDGQITTPRIVIESTPYAIRSGEAAHSSDSDTLGTHPATFYQARVSNACASGSAIASIDATGGVMCQPVPSYTATSGGGLLLTAGGFSVDPTVVQSRVSGVCNTGAIETILQDGTVTCLTAGTGLAFSAGQFNVDFTTTQHAIAPCAAGSLLSKTDSTGTATCYTPGAGLQFNAATSAWRVDTTTIQKRVTGTCTAGAVTAIAADGTVTCGTGTVFVNDNTTQSTNSTTYASPGPTVTATIGASGNALVTMTAKLAPAPTQIATVGLSIDNATPSDTQSLQVSNGSLQASATYMVTGLSAGSHTFALSYKISGGGSVNFTNRSVIVTPQ